MDIKEERKDVKEGRKEGSAVIRKATRKKRATVRGQDTWKDTTHKGWVVGRNIKGGRKEGNNGRISKKEGRKEGRIDIKEGRKEVDIKEEITDGYQ
jgi:hypothetical protein